MRTRRALAGALAAAVLTGGLAASSEDAGDPVPTPAGETPADDTSEGGYLEGGEPGSIEGDDDVDAEPSASAPSDE